MICDCEVVWDLYKGILTDLGSVFLSTKHLAYSGSYIKNTKIIISH